MPESKIVPAHQMVRHLTEVVWISQKLVKAGQSPVPKEVPELAKTQ